MPYFMVEDFRRGLDSRRMPETTAVGALTAADGVFINGGGEIEKSLGFIEVPEISAACASAIASGGLFGPVRTHNGGFAFVAKIAKPVGFPTSVDDTPLYWCTLPAAAPNLLTGVGCHPFSTKLFFVGWHDPAGAVPYYGDLDGELAQVTTNVPISFTTTHANKVFGARGNFLGFSAVLDPADWAGTGSGFIDLGARGVAQGAARGMGVYFNQLAVFGETGVQLWNMGADPDASTLAQEIGGINLVSQRAITPYGDGDLLFLDRSGVRSLRARDSSNFARVDDIGSPVDDLIRDKIDVLGLSTAKFTPGAVEPITGQFWLAMNDTIFVLSRFPSAKVQAWTEMRLPVGAKLTNKNMAAAGDRLMFTVNDGTTYLYGGTGVRQYDYRLAEAATPFLGLGDPATTKLFKGLDVACYGTWQVDVAVDPTVGYVWQPAAQVQSTTFQLQRIPLNLRGTHIAVRVRTRDAVPAKVGQIGIHYDTGSR